MRARAQHRWALVFANGDIGHRPIRFSRKQVIATIIEEWREYEFVKRRYSRLTDAQLWRVIKRLHGYTVRRISMRVVS